MATITLDEFNRSLSDMVRTGAIGEAIHRATAEVGIRAVAITQRDYLRGPRPERLGRVSGALARSVRFKTRPTQRAVFLSLTAGGGPEGVTYARKHELGEGIRPRPFLRPGRDEAIQEAPRIFTSEIGRTIRRGLGGL
mgnify:FL=1